jgi:hypothetical protein
VVQQTSATVSVFINGTFYDSETGIATTGVGAQDWTFPSLGSINISDVATYFSGGAPPLSSTEIATHYALTQQPLSEAGDPLIISGNACVPFQLTIPITMSNPRLFIGDSFVGVNPIPSEAVDEVILNTESGTISYVNSAGITVETASPVTGDPFLQLQPPIVVVALVADTGSTGTATISYRPAVISA